MAKIESAGYAKLTPTKKAIEERKKSDAFRKSEAFHSDKALKRSTSDGYMPSRATESRKFNEGLKKDREIYTGKKLNMAEHKSISRHEDKELNKISKEVKVKQRTAQ